MSEIGQLLRLMIDQSEQACLTNPRASISDAKYIIEFNNSLMDEFKRLFDFEDGKGRQRIAIDFDRVFVFFKQDSLSFED